MKIGLNFLPHNIKFLRKDLLLISGGGGDGMPNKMIVMQIDFSKGQYSTIYEQVFSEADVPLKMKVDTATQSILLTTLTDCLTFTYTINKSKRGTKSKKKKSKKKKKDDDATSMPEWPNLNINIEEKHRFSIENNKEDPQIKVVQFSQNKHEAVIVNDDFEVKRFDVVNAKKVKEMKKTCRIPEKSREIMAIDRIPTTDNMILVNKKRQVWVTPTKFGKCIPLPLPLPTLKDASYHYRDIVTNSNERQYIFASGLRSQTDVYNLNWSHLKGNFSTKDLRVKRDTFFKGYSTAFASLNDFIALGTKDSLLLYNATGNEIFKKLSLHPAAVCTIDMLDYDDDHLLIASASIVQTLDISLYPKTSPSRGWMIYLFLFTILITFIAIAYPLIRLI
mmetsp:Transcript_10533/g.15397  ORF Transcript_10533/g.15397 Transcript_10533/m.15397 type:complete len:391 (+) Transcript_10533:73-1245(+)